MKLSIFYSWLSDLLNSTNRGFIEKALEAAIKSLEGQLDAKLALCVDRDTQNVPGTPDIVSTIFRKIEESQIFIADISIIHPPAPAAGVAPHPTGGLSGLTQPAPPAGVSQEDRPKRTPNPNVLLELGYAVKHLGWEKVICVYNEANGHVNELSFDLRTRRILTYSLSKGQDKADQRKSLAAKFVDAIKSISQHESHLRSIREDIAQVRLEIHEGVHLPTLQSKVKEREAKRLQAENLSSEIASARTVEERGSDSDMPFWTIGFRGPLALGRQYMMSTSSAWVSIIQEQPRSESSSSK
jgi:hypothetical protein